MSILLYKFNTTSRLINSAQKCVRAATSSFNCSNHDRHVSCATIPSFKRLSQKFPEERGSLWGRSGMGRDVVTLEYSRFLSQQCVRYSLRSSDRPNSASDNVRGEIKEKPKSLLQTLHRIKTNLERDMILTVPNVLTFSRMLSAPLLGYLVINQSYHMACAVFILAGLTDMLDGYIARNFVNQTSALGSFMDPLADKLLVSVLVISLTVVHLLPVALTALVLTRDVCLTCGGFYVRYISLNPRPKSLREFFDLTNRSAELQPTLISKVNTAVQLSLVGFTLAAPVFNFIDHPALQALWYLTAATTLASGIGYIFAKDTFKLLKQTRKKGT